MKLGRNVGLVYCNLHVFRDSILFKKYFGTRFVCNQARYLSDTYYSVMKEKTREGPVVSKPLVAEDARKIRTQDDATFASQIRK